ncbi:hypothetical protein TKK_0002235 [Trichogramma kaykai]
MHWGTRSSRRPLPKQLLRGCAGIRNVYFTWKCLFVDAKDKLGRTPLQLAVANLWPDCIDILFEHGADLSSFVFPNDYFAKRYKSIKSDISFNDRLKLASGALVVVEKIENRGYQLKRSDALTIMKFFAEYKLFEYSTDLKKYWYDDEKFITKAKEIRISLGLSFDEYEELTALYLCKKLSRGFFRSWALDTFMEFIRDRLPILRCEMIIEQLSNEDLCNICLAAAGQSS